MNELQEAYLDLLQRSLTLRANGPLTMHGVVPANEGPWLRKIIQRRLLRRGGDTLLMHPIVYDPDGDPQGKLHVYQLAPGIMTMVGNERLANMRQCLLDVIDKGVPGDVIETGVWRGGTTILMRGILKAMGVTDRKVFVADSFEGLPPPNAEKYPADKGLNFHLHKPLAVSLEDVQANFERYGLLDDQVVFLKGWFKDTLPGLADDQRFAIARLDGDLYESTMDALTNLYPKLSPGGYLIIDDYEIPACRKAVHDYRDEHGIAEEVMTIDWTGVYWQKSA
ncbi:MAG: TylF/MycF/NovP-related O-methyltransferase [Acidimicrobiales bacterium]